MEFINKYQELFYKLNTERFLLYKEYVAMGKILVVGHGLGFEYDLIHEENKNLVGLDTEISEFALHKDKIEIYSGETIPYRDDTFDTVVCNFVLHHSNDPKKLFSELVRVSKKTIVISEETHKNFIQKVSTVYTCWNMNRKAGQFVNINWSSYLHTKKLECLAKNLKVKKWIKDDRGVHIYEFLILQKN